MSKDSNNLSELTDEQLAANIAIADSSIIASRQAVDSFDEIYRRHAHLLAAFVAARTSRDDVNDALQTIWLKIWKNTPDQFHGGSYRGWLYQIARNTMIDRHRTKKSSVSISDEHAENDSNPLSGLLENERMKILRDCFSTLATREADVLRNLLAGNTYDDVCARLQINANVAYKSAQAGKSKLRSCVEKKLS